MTDRQAKLAVFGLVLVVAGLFIVWQGLTPTPMSRDRDADGYLLSDALAVDQPSRAVITEDVELLRGSYECANEESFLFSFFSPADVRMQGVATGGDALFMGIAPAAAVDAYFDGVAHHDISDWECNQDDITPVEYTGHEGAVVPDAPGTERFWVTSVSGTGEQTLDWTIEDGEWAVVIMNADASPGVSAEVRFGALAPSSLTPLAWTVFAFGVVVVIGGGLLIYLASRRPATTAPVDSDDASLV